MSANMGPPCASTSWRLYNYTYPPRRTHPHTRTRTHTFTPSGPLPSLGWLSSLAVRCSYRVLLARDLQQRNSSVSGEWVLSFGGLFFNRGFEVLVFFFLHGFSYVREFMGSG